MSASKPTVPDDPARLAQLQERIRVLEEEVAALKRGLPVLPAPAASPATKPAAPVPAPDSVTTSPASPRPVPTQFVPNWDAQVPTFAAAGLKNELVSALRENGFIKPTALQSTALVPLIQGKSTLIQCPAGGGRTVSYALSALQAIHPESKHVQVLILASSKERAAQIVHDIRALSGGIWTAQDPENDPETRVYSCLPGTKTDLDRHALSTRPNIVVGTPGRVFHLLDRAHFPVSHLRLLIADEVDDLLTTFRQLVSEIMRFLPAPAPSAEHGLQTVWGADHFKSSRSVLANALQYAPDPVMISIRHHQDGAWRIVQASATKI